MVVTHKAVLGKTIDQLELDSTGYSVTVTRVSRTEIEMTALRNWRCSSATPVQPWAKRAIAKATKELGNRFTL